QDMPYIEAFHGSRADFDVFSTDFIGKAEYGLNFTQNRGIAQTYSGTGGTLYRVNLAADADSFLKAGAPLSEQPKPIADALRTLAKDHEKLASHIEDPAATGSSLLSALRMDTGSAPEAAALLRDAGVSGIKYGGDEFVIFDDKIIKITHK